MICIYQLNFTEGTYIGKTTNFRARLAHHLRKDSCGDKLKEAWKTQGYLGHTVLEECKIADLNDREIYWISTLNPSLNTLSGGETMSGLNHPRNKTSKEEIEEIVRLLELNFKFSVIAEELNLPYTRVYDICTGYSHAWATEHLNLDDYRHNREDTIFYDINNVKHIVGYGERVPYCESKGIPISSLNRLTNSFNSRGLSLIKHKEFLVKTPDGEKQMTEPELYYALKDLPSASFTRKQVIEKRRESKEWKIVKEIT